MKKGMVSLKRIKYMGLFDFFKPKSNNVPRFIEEAAFKSNLDSQLKMNSETLNQLRELKVTEDKELKLEYFFYTNSNDKAVLLVTELVALGYTVEYYASAGNKNLFVITGWTIKLKMSDEGIKQWVKRMCELGFKFDSEFDGWGTTPEQS